MLKNIFLSSLIVFLFSCKAGKNTITKTIKPSIKIVNFEALEPYLKANDTKTYVINFWATWCAPCVKELPFFQELDKAYTDDKLSILLVSLDFPDKLKSKLIPFVEKHKIKQKVILLDAPNENEWIPKINTNWSGSIPATIIFNKEKRTFYEQSFTKEQLFNEVKKFTKQ